MDQAEAREIANELSEDPGWREALPDCPCTVEDIEKEEIFKKDERAIEKYHPGAATAYRSDSIEHTNERGESMNPAQQCTYDSENPEGKLITHGPGAGTPDSAAAEFPTYYEHYKQDVQTWEALGPEEYNETWKPNNDKNCEENPPQENLPIKEEETPIKEGDIPRDELLLEQTEEKGKEAESTLESFIQGDPESSSELDSFLQEGNSSGFDMESFTEGSSGESESTAQTELSSSGF